MVLTFLKCVSSVIVLLQIKILVNYFDVEFIQSWSFIASIFVFLRQLDFGITSYFRNQIAGLTINKISEQHELSLTKFYEFKCKFYLILVRKFILVILISILINFYFSYHSIAKSISIISLFTLFYIIEFNIKSGECILFCQNRVIKIEGLNIVGLLFQFIFLLILIKFNYDSIFCITFSYGLPRLIVLILYHKFVFSWIYSFKKISIFDFATISRLESFNPQMFGFFKLQIISYLLFGSIPILLKAFSSPLDGALYHNVMRIYSVVQLIVISTTAPFWNNIAKNLRRNNFLSVNLQIKNLCYISFLTSFLCIAIYLVSLKYPEKLFLMYSDKQLLLYACIYNI